MTTDFRELQKKNKRTTRLLLCASFFLVFLVSFVLGLALTGFLGFAIFALIFSFVLTYFQYKQSSKLALRATGLSLLTPISTLSYITLLRRWRYLLDYLNLMFI